MGFEPMIRINNPYNGLANRRLQPLGHLSSTAMCGFNLPYPPPPRQSYHRLLNPTPEPRRLAVEQRSTRRQPATSTSLRVTHPEPTNVSGQYPIKTFIELYN